MTWIAACSGERGIHQETVMTDEERQKLCATLRRMQGMLGYDCSRAADEIERLAKENKELRKSLHRLHSARETDMGTAE